MIEWLVLGALALAGGASSSGSRTSSSGGRTKHLLTGRAGPWAGDSEIQESMKDPPLTSEGQEDYHRIGLGGESAGETTIMNDVHDWPALDTASVR